MYAIRSYYGDNIEHLGIYGFGAAAHIVAQIAVQQGKKVYAFTRSGDIEAQNFARRLGAIWAGASDERNNFRIAYIIRSYTIPSTRLWQPFRVPGPGPSRATRITPPNYSRPILAGDC